MIMKKSGFIKQAILFSLLFCAAVLLAKNADVVPIDHEPSHHFVLENDSLRMFDVTVAPHASTLMHRHDRDYIFITLGDSEISNERMNEKPTHVDLKDGDARFVPGGFAHVAKNLADTPFHNLTIELKDPGAPVCGIGTTPACEKDSNADAAQELLSTERVIARVTTLDSGHETPAHTHKFPHLAVALDDITFENHPADKPVNTFSMKKGEFKWVGETGITHSLKNTGKQPGRLFMLEFVTPSAQTSSHKK